MLLEMRHITKAFNGVCALRDVRFALRAGEVHGLVGENGAGKSTVIKLLTGVYSLDAGEILWDGAPLDASTPAKSRAAGINVIHQDRTLVPAFTAVENAWLGLPYPTRRGRVDWKAMRARVMEAARALEIDIDPDQLARDMSPPQRTCLEIVRATLSECRLLILDEPTAALTDRESERLFALMDRLRDRGVAILYVTHRLDEIFRLTDRVTVLKNGENACTLTTSETTREALVAAMTDDWQGAVRTRAGRAGEELLRAEHVASRDGAVRDASVCVRGGEILGLFGLGGSGRTELLECLYGYRPMASGRVTLNGKPFSRPSPAAALKRGMALICEDRRGKALVGGLSVRENITLSSLEDFSRAGVVNHRDSAARADDMARQLDVRMAGPDQPVIQLSGGNQQKVVFARALMTQPGVFLCDEPTQAVDVRTRHEIHHLLRRQADAGAAVLFVSSDLKELLEVSDRVQIIVRGETREVLENDALTTQQVLSLCYED